MTTGRGEVAPAFGAMRRFLEPRPRQRPGEVCEMCAAPLAETHQHVVQVDARRLLCTCRACFLLFTNAGAAEGRYRAVPQRYAHTDDVGITAARWDALQIPVGIAFFFVNSALGRWVAQYPSPAGATESLLPLDEWESLLADDVWLSSTHPEPDVEAFLVHRIPDAEGERFECFLLPIDACYELVGRVRLAWRGFDGGEVWHDLEDFLHSLRQRSTTMAATGRGDDG